MNYHTLFENIIHLDIKLQSCSKQRATGKRQYDPSIAERSCVTEFNRASRVTQSQHGVLSRNL